MVTGCCLRGFGSPPFKTISGSEDYPALCAVGGPAWLAEHQNASLAGGKKIRNIGLGEFLDVLVTAVDIGSRLEVFKEVC